MCYYRLDKEGTLLIPSVGHTEMSNKVRQMHLQLQI